MLPFLLGKTTFLTNWWNFLPVFFAILNHWVSISCSSLTANVSISPCHSTRCCVTTRDSGAFLAFRNIRLIGITCIPKHGTGWSNSLSSNSTATWLPRGNSIFFEVTICGAGLTPFRIRHNRRNSWSSMVTVASLLLAWRNTSLHFVVRRLASTVVEITAWPNLSKWKIAARTGITSIQLRENEKNRANHNTNPNGLLGS